MRAARRPQTSSRGAASHPMHGTRRVRTRTASASHPARSAAASAHRASACARCRAYPWADSRRSRTSSERCLAWTWAWLSNMRGRGKPSLTTQRRTCGEGGVACGLIFCRPGGEGRHTANVPAPDSGCSSDLRAYFLSRSNANSPIRRRCGAAERDTWLATRDAEAPMRGEPACWRAVRAVRTMCIR